MKKSALFISALDFKERSIQVILKTPGFYAANGWDVKYLVARDNSIHGNYYYEKIINPDGVKIYRFNAPLTPLINIIKNHVLRTIVSKIAGYLTIIILALKADKLLRENNVDIIYGYEIHGVLAVALLRLFGRIKSRKIVNRFQGTWLNEYFKEKNIIKILFNIDSLIALRLKSDLCIMTDDGTSGDKAMQRLRSKSLRNFKFWTNGVDGSKADAELINQYKKKLGIKKSSIIAVSVCRLELWKRVDRAVRIIDRLVKKFNYNNIVYIIAGEGNQRKYIESLIKELAIDNHVLLTGAVSHDEAGIFTCMADIFFSMNDLSNVGNPLLEAIRANKIIFTLNNGDTGSWIKHRHNGFIYELSDDLFDSAARDIDEVIRDSGLCEMIKSNLKKTENERLWTWDERLQAEIKEVEKMIGNNGK